MRSPLYIALLTLLLTAAVAAGGAPVERTTSRGPVTVVVRVEPASVPIGDTVELFIEVTAEPEVELFLPEFGQALERLPILDFVPRSQIDDAGKTVSTQLYRLQPDRSGEQTIPPIMIEFVDRRAGQRPAPEGEDAYELLTERLAFAVESVLPDSAAAELHPPLGALLEFAFIEDRRVWFGLALLAVCLGAVVCFWIWHRRRRSAPATIDAFEAALKRLEQLRRQPLPAAEAMDAFFVELTDIVRRYVERRFGLHAPELTTEEFLDATATSPDLSVGHQSFLRDFLSSADRVKFAREVPSSDVVSEALSAVARFLSETRRTEPEHA
ncbi:MAG: hypothetical protein HOI95_00055 [Chromatiales bacterium]|jgi:hypothetical protein|nr:hypothetical protein [Chromatiales bacterium]